MNKFTRVDAELEKRREADRQARHDLALEGLTPSAESTRLSEEVVAGRISEEEYRAQILARRS